MKINEKTNLCNFKPISFEIKKNNILLETVRNK